MKNLFKAIGFLILIIGVYLSANMLPGALIGVLAGIQHSEAMTSDPNAFDQIITSKIATYSLPIMIFASITTFLMILIFFLFRKDSFINYTKWRPLRLKDGFVIGLFGFFLNLFLIAIIHYASLYLPIQDQLEAYSELMNLALDTSFLIIFIAVVIVAPFFEEILLRGIIFNDFRNALPTWLALIIQALLFGLMHLNMIQGTYAFFLGLILGIIYLNYKTILAPIILHLTFNMTSTVLSEVFPEMESYVFTLLIIGLIGSIASVWLLIRQYRADYYLPTNIKVSKGSFLKKSPNI